MHNIMKLKNRVAKLSLLAVSGIILSGCLDGSGDSSSTTDTTSQTGFTVSGTISGVTRPLSINLNGETIQITTDGSFAFSTALSDAATYSVAASSNTHQTCEVSNGSGTVSGSDISDVAISCRKVIYFAGKDATNGSELWRSDGTEAGTYRVSGINLGQNIVNTDPRNIAVLDDNTVVFVGRSTEGMELFKSDGTEAGTMMIKDINTGTGPANPFGFTMMNGVLYFTAEETQYNPELWHTDGTEAGTYKVGAGFTAYGYGAWLTAIDNTLYFVASNDFDSTNYELWKSDGTDAGTVMVKDINPGMGVSSSPEQFMAMGGELYFNANDGTHGVELWKSDGTDAGTVMVKDVNAGANNGSIGPLAVMGNTLYFRGLEGVYGDELWKTDGTDAGTVLVKDINPGNAHGSPMYVSVFNNTLYFQALEPNTRQELWKSDGTDVGTVMVKDIYPGTVAGMSYGLTEVNGALYFSGNDGSTGGNELWRTDGTTAGTTLAADLFCLSGGNQCGGFPQGFVAGQPFTLGENGSFYFKATDDGGVTYRLTRSDGTQAGTVILKGSELFL